MFESSEELGFLVCTEEAVRSTEHQIPEIAIVLIFGGEDCGPWITGIMFDVGEYIVIITW